MGSANRHIPGCEGSTKLMQASSTAEDPVCCMAMTATCMACKEKRSVKDFCSDSAHREVPGCEKHINLKQVPSSGHGRACCMAMTATCMACKQKRTVEDFCSV